jgi:nucleotide-binding universal stress UspA family protein
MKWRKLLCPIDFSPGSEVAARLALRLAAKTGAAVTLAHVVEPIYWMPDMGIAEGDVFGAVDRAADESLERRHSEARRLFPGLGIDVARINGVPWRRIVDYAELEAFDLIIMGTRGRTGIKHLLGSVAERVVRHAACPVVVVRGEQRADAPLFNAILCGVDFSEPSRVALRSATELAKTFGASLTLQHVYESPIDMAPPATILPTVQADMRRARTGLADWQAEAKRLGADDVRIVWTEGTPWQEITKRAHDYGHDLVVVGTHGRTGLQHALIGSVAERVVRHAPCPVITIRAGGREAAGP